ncbi:MAG: HlyD family secretion protein [Pirellulales bacterium]
MSATLTSPKRERKPTAFPTEAERPDSLSALMLVESPKLPWRLARLLWWSLIAIVFAMGFAPWQQTAVGTGRVVAFAPLERQQTVQSPISGVVTEFEPHIVEGSRVKKGELILRIRDNDPLYLDRLKEKLEAKKRKIEAATTKADAYKSKMTAFNEARAQVIEAAEQQIEVARQKVRAEEQGVEAAAAAELQARLNLERQKSLFKDGLTSKLNLEVEERKFTESAAKLKQAERYVEAALGDLKTKDAELFSKTREADAKIETARAEFQEAVGEIALAEAEMLGIQSEVSKQETQDVSAPRDGTVLRLLVNQGGEMVSKGDPLFILVPESAARAAEIWVDGNDAPLITKGRKVRLQFEGWPAVQFAGWPSVAVGTFGGEVSTVDATDNGKGKFRVLIVPEDGEIWPEERFLRQGVRANGWVLLNQVKLGYEVWRKNNGFPPSLTAPEPLPESKEVKGKGK